MQSNLPDVRLIGSPATGGEFLGLLEDGSSREEIVHIHDYERIYRVSGLYEYVVQERLGCRSPQVTAQAFAHLLEAHGFDPRCLRVLDLGAGTGLVGELLGGLGVGTIVGLDALAAARDACLRDRPGVYRDYFVGTLDHPPAELVDKLLGLQLSGLVAAGAFGGTHAPAGALAAALALLAPGAPVVFTIDERWMQDDGPDGFRTPFSRLLSSGELHLLERSRFRHRLTTDGKPVYYELVAARRTHRPPR